MLYQFRKAFIFGHAAEYNPIAANDLGPLSHQLDLGGLAAGAYRQSVKFDFGHIISGDQSRIPRLWECSVIIEPTSAPNGTSQVHAYLGFSDSPVGSVGNPGGLSGEDDDWFGYGAASTDADETTTQLMSLGSATVSADATEQHLHFNQFTIRGRYGILVIANKLNVNFAASAAEMAVRLKPIFEVDE